MLYLRLFVVVEHVELLDCTSLLRRKVKIVVSIMFILALALLWQLTDRRVSPCHRINILFYAWSRIKRHVHNV